MTEFKPLELTDKPVLDPYLKARRIESSELVFTTLYIWREAMQVTYCLIGDCLVLATKDNGNPASLRFPLGKGDKRLAVTEACRYFEAIGEQPKFYGLTEDMAAQLTAMFPGAFEVTEMEDYGDYVYLAERLIHLSGKKLHSKKNHVNSFKKLYPYEYSPITSRDEAFIMEGYSRWFQSDDRYLQSEYRGIGDILHNFEYLGLTGAKLTVDGQLCAFTIGEPLNDNTAVIHIEKADTAYRGSYSAINQMFAENAWPHMEYINREEDCGIEGLRKAKQSYHPDKMIVKYKAVLKGELA